MSKPRAFQLSFAVISLLIAGFILFRFFSKNDGISERAFFYDLSERKLFTAARTSIPPIRGINDSEEDAVGAVVISTSGDPADRKSRRIAYLERYSPELKQDLEKAQKTGQAAQIDRGTAQQLRFVRTEADTNWHSLATDEGNRIITEWATPGPNGITPVVCTP